MLAAALLLAGCGTAARTSADRFTATGEMIALSGGDAGAPNACFTCHGLDGGGDGAGAPRLAGLDRGYLLRQLEAFADGTRRHPRMESIARQLAPDDRQEVANYYAAMPFRPAPSSTTAMSVLYTQGDPSRGLLACAACHGAAGEGQGAAIPPLAGQSAAYIAGQIEVWRHAKRRNDPGGVMLSISRRLYPAEIEAVAAYAATLGGGPPHRESRAASRAAHRADPRNGASAPPPRAAEPG